MKNLFDFATKETTQDSFLSWLFANWNEPTCKDLAADLLNKFGIDYNTIINVEVFKQISHIDICVVIETTNRPILLVIEDKTDSNAHDNQLLRYDGDIFGKYNTKTKLYSFNVLKRLNKLYGKNIFIIPDEKSPMVNNILYDVVRVFYKSSIITDEDEKNLKECITLPDNYSARFTAKSGWIVFDINDIYNIITKHMHSNMLIDMYIEHIVDIYNKLHNTSMPTTDDIEEWYVYLTNVIKPYFKSKGYLVRIWNWNGKESGIGIKCKHSDNDDYYNGEYVYVAFYNKCFGKAKGRIKFVMSLEAEDVIKNKDTIDKLKQEIKRMNDTFGTSKFPLVIKDSYMKPESKTLAMAMMPIDTTENLIHSLEMAAEQLAYIDHEFKVL